LTPLLDDIRILELGHYVAAPFATRVLADLGADVIKVEPPGDGDPVRTWGSRIDGNALWWSVHGRNKRSITINMREKRGREMALQLARHCDVVVENYRVGQLEKWGITPAALAEARPGIVLVRISGYGQTGPEASRAGFGVIGEAKGGLRHLCAYPPGESALPPVRAGIAIGDSIAGFYGAVGALAAIHAQRREGAKDCKVIDVALGEAVLSLLEGCLPEYGLLGRVREPSGSRLKAAAPSNAYKSKDGAWILIAGNSDPLFRTLTTLMQQPELASDPRFVDNPARCEHIDELDAIINQWVGTLDSEDVLALMEEGNIPSSKIYTVADIATDRQYRARDMISEIADPLLGNVLHPGVVPIVEGLNRRSQIRWPGPSVGQHNEEVFQSLLGLDTQHLAALKQDGII
jgi:crotonobetainyl-CoA:carnitine CoA-transferase CaiB-like acyl-CoA transferase